MLSTSMLLLVTILHAVAGFHSLSSLQQSVSCFGPRTSSFPIPLRAASSFSSTIRLQETDPAAIAAKEAADMLQDDGMTEREREIARLRAAEKFIVKDTGNYECLVCGYVYKPDEGDAALYITKGTDWADVPSSYRCKQCGADKARFESQRITIAGFADNQQYGFGGNSMTEGQKSGLIFGGLGFFFLLFLSGYALN